MTVYQIILPKSNKFKNKDSYSLRRFGRRKIVKIFENEVNIYSAKIDRKWHLEKYGFVLSESEILVYLMHKQAWQLFLKSGDDYCIIVDNSLYLNKIIDQETLNQLEKKHDWDIFFPFTLERITKYDKLKRIDLLNINSREYKDYEPYLLGKKWGSSIYFIRKSGAKILLKTKKISQTVEDEMLLLSYENKLNIYTRNVKWFSIRNQPFIFNYEREKNIYDSIFNNTNWNEKLKSKIRILLSLLSQTAYKCNTDLILQGGTHLGYIRHGGIMPWDDDVDIGIDEDNLEVFLKELKTHAELDFDLFAEPWSKSNYYKVWFKKGKKIDQYKYTFPFVDLWIFNKIKDDLVFKNGIICPNTIKYGFDEVIFEGTPFKVPSNSIECLDARYKDWKKTIRVYVWSHMKENFGFYRLKASINVDEKGRIIGSIPTS